uniref:Leucine-rich repeat-containing N-terminal plant-type domain-containing protein n=1 Tax=Aegilops tauschii TaxID=37682 RepID=R7WC90_AEGTA
MADDTKFLLLALLLSCSSLCFGSEADIQCLKSVQQSVIDPNGVLKSLWYFENPYPNNAYICRFTGVEFWYPDENRVLSLRLGNLGLEGPFPQGPIPSLLQNFSASNFAGNQGLCGAPLDDCPPSKRRWRPVRIRLPRLNDQSSIGAAVGFVVGFVVAFYFPHCFVCSERLRAYVVRI